MLDIFNRTKEINAIDYSLTLDDMKSMTLWSGFDIEKQLVFIEMNQLPIGMLQYYREDEISGDVNLNMMGGLEKEYIQTTIPQAMLNYTERKLREMVAGITTEGENRFCKRLVIKAKKQLNFFIKNNYTPVRYYSLMVRPIEKPLGKYPLPEGIEIKPAKPEDYRKIWEANVEAFMDHWGITQRREEHYQNWLRNPQFQPNLWKVAWQGEEVCAMVENYIDANTNTGLNIKRGYLEGIFVRRPWRKRGLAKAIIAESIRMFKDIGMTETALGVDTENLSGALRLYTALGYEVVEGQTSVILHKKL